MGSTFISFVFLPSLSYTSGVTAAIHQRIFCLSVFLFCWIVYCHMRHSFFFSAFSSFALALVLQMLSFVIHLPMSCSSLVFLFLWQFYSPFVLTCGPATSFACSCVLFAFIFLRSRLSVVDFLFHFSFCIRQSRFCCFDVWLLFDPSFMRLSSLVPAWPTCLVQYILAGRRGCLLRVLYSMSALVVGSRFFGHVLVSFGVSFL